MAVLSDYTPCGWGVFWEEKEMPCSVLKTTEKEALEFAARTAPGGAAVEQVFRRRQTIVFR